MKYPLFFILLIVSSFSLLAFRPIPARVKSAALAVKVVSADAGSEELVAKYEQIAEGLYSRLDLGSKGLTYSIFEKALTGFYNMKAVGLLEKGRDVLTVIDYSKPSTKERMWILDLNDKKVLFNSLVAHGMKSGEDIAVQFSNTENSHMSSLGFYRTKNIYFGKHGKSLVIEGLDKDLNDNAEKRYIVIHGAPYVSKTFIDCNGRLGRSHGCPAVPVELTDAIISSIEGGNLIFAYHPYYQSDQFQNKKVAASYMEAIF